MHFLTEPFRDYIKFDGIASREDFWVFSLAYIPLLIIFAKISPVLCSFYVLATASPYFGLMFRRLHDAGLSGAWSFVLFVPVIGIPLLAILLSLESKSKSKDVKTNPQSEQNSASLITVGSGLASNVASPDTNQSDSYDESNEDVLRCPKCGSQQIHVAKKGFNTGSACCGAILLGPLGLLCGTSGSNQIMKTCLKCKKTW